MRKIKRSLSEYQPSVKPYRKMIKKKHIMAIDLVFIIGTILAVSFFVGYARPLVIAPIDDLITSNTSVLFEFNKADLIFIDDNLEFTSPEKIYAQDNLIINLKPGKYYWKVEGLAGTDSDVREFTILSEVNLKLRESVSGKFEIINAGNTELNVDVYEDGKQTGNIILNVDETKEVSGTKFIGSMENE